MKVSGKSHGAENLEEPFTIAKRFVSCNQSRICGKGVGLGLFPSDSLQSQLYEFIEITHIDHTIV